MSASRGISAALAFSIALVALVSACTSEDIVLAKIPTQPTPRSPAEGQKCVDETDCSKGGNTFCARKSCDAFGGACELRPVFCDEEAAPVCGCDGVTYWNDCLRRAAGVPAMSEGECADTAIPCGFDGSGPPRKPPPGEPPPPGPGGEPPLDPDAPPTRGGCPPETYCARLLPPISFEPMPPTPTPRPPNSCPPDPRGTCWALPAVCPGQGGSGPDRWVACGEEKGCATTCEAIRSGVAHRRQKACD